MHSSALASFSNVHMYVSSLGNVDVLMSHVAYTILNPLRGHMPLTTNTACRINLDKLILSYLLT